MTSSSTAPRADSSWMTVAWPLSSLGDPQALGKSPILSPPLSATPSPSTSSHHFSPLSPSTTHLPRLQLVVDLSTYPTLPNPPHQPLLQTTFGHSTPSDDRTHHMVLRPTTMHRRQTYIATSTSTPLL
jgi:hypothetical protein